jgi:putative transposase
MRIIDPKTGRPYFEKRRKRYNDLGEPRELTFSCYKHYQFLAKDRTREWFLEALAEARSRFGIQVWAYVLMPEHVHLLVYPGTHGEEVSDFLKAIKEPVARKAIKFLKSNAPAWLERIKVRERTKIRHRFWQPGGGYDRNVTLTETLRFMIEYIHANPVRRGLVSKPKDWEWSSARWFSGIRPVKMEMDKQVLKELQWV